MFFKCCDSAETYWCQFLQQCQLSSAASVFMIYCSTVKAYKWQCYGSAVCGCVCLAVAANIIY
jgi:hypothetical protein